MGTQKETAAATTKKRTVKKNIIPEQIPEVSETSKSIVEEYCDNDIKTVTEEKDVLNHDTEEDNGENFGCLLDELEEVVEKFDIPCVVPAVEVVSDVIKQTDIPSKQEKKDYFRLKRQAIAKKISSLRIERKYGTITKDSDIYLNIIDRVVSSLKELANEQKMVNVGYGVEKAFDISSDDLDVVFYLLEESGYHIYRGSDGTKRLRILTTNQIQYKEIYNFEKIFGLKAVFNRFRIGRGKIGTITIKQAVASDIIDDESMPKLTSEKITKVRIIRPVIVSLDATFSYHLEVGTICDVESCLVNDSNEIYKYVIHIDQNTSMGIPWWFAEPEKDISPIETELAEKTNA